jgi:glucosamine--fructose-6-phosphate aminotransferase (isomerizing)
VGITQSGETIDTLRALQKARTNGCKTLAISNVPGSSVTRIVDQSLYTQAGIEIGVAASKTFTAQLVTLYLLALSYASLDIMTYTSLVGELRRLSLKVQQVLDDKERIAQKGSELAQFNNVFFIGRGISHPVAMEGALKMKEISYVYAEAYPGGELKHGPFALLNDNVAVVAITTKDDTYTPILNNIEEIKARGTHVIALAEEGDDNIKQLADFIIPVPKVSPLFSPIVNSVALQLLAYYVAKELGRPIDLPANLAKSVTVP